MAWKLASLIPHVKYELTLILFPNANAQLWSLDIPELTHSATQQIHRDEVEEGHCKIGLSGIKRTPKPQSITIPLQYFFHWKVWFLMTSNWFFFLALLCFNIKSMSLRLSLPESFVWCYKQIQPNIKIHKGDGGEAQLLKATSSMLETKHLI